MLSRMDRRSEKIPREQAIKPNLPFVSFAYLPECPREFYSLIFRLYPGLKCKRLASQKEGAARDPVSSLLVCMNYKLGW